MKKIDQTSTRYHGHHWWYGVSNEKLADGKPVRLPGWHVVHCWTAYSEGYAIGAHFTSPMKQREMQGVWGAELIPPPVPAAQTRAVSRPNVVAGRRCDRSNAEIEQACSVLIEAEVEKGDFSDSALIGLLSDVVRLTREYSDATIQKNAETLKAKRLKEQEDFTVSNTPDIQAMDVRYVPTGTEAAVCSDIARRQQQGIKKYGQLVRDNPLHSSNG